MNSCKLEINLIQKVFSVPQQGPVLSPGDTKRNKMERAQFEVESLGLESWFSHLAAVRP